MCPFCYIFCLFSCLYLSKMLCPLLFLFSAVFCFSTISITLFGILYLRFSTLSRRVISSLSILISATYHLYFWLLVSVQISAPYVIAAAEVLVGRHVTSMTSFVYRNALCNTLTNSQANNFSDLVSQYCLKFYGNTIHFHYDIFETLGNGFFLVNSLY